MKIHSDGLHIKLSAVTLCFGSHLVRLPCKAAQRPPLPRGKLLAFGYNQRYGACTVNVLCAWSCLASGWGPVGSSEPCPGWGKPSQVWWAPQKAVGPAWGERPPRGGSRGQMRDACVMGRGELRGQLPALRLTRDSAPSLSLCESLNSLRKKREQQPGEFFFIVIIVVGFYCSRRSLF